MCLDGIGDYFTLRWAYQIGRHLPLWRTWFCRTFSHQKRCVGTLTICSEQIYNTDTHQFSRYAHVKYTFQPSIQIHNLSTRPKIPMLQHRSSEPIISSSLSIRCPTPQEPTKHPPFSYPSYIPFKKLFSLIFALLSLLIAALNSSLLASASNAPDIVPLSLDGRSMDCCVIGILGARASAPPEAMSLASILARCFAALRRSFLDFALDGC
jgi:hypothetical protein